MNNICRTCLSSSDDLSSLEIDKNLNVKIELLTAIQISQDSKDYPSTICQNCIESFNKYYCFRIIVIQADKELKERYETKKTEKAAQKKLGRRKRKASSKDTASSKRKKIQEGINDLKVEIKQEPSDNVPREKEICDNLRCKKVTGNRCNKHSVKKEVLRSEEPQMNFHSSNKETVIEKSPNYDPFLHDFSDEENTDFKQEPDSDNKNDSFLTCGECKLAFSTRAELFNHKRSHHTAPGICSICGAIVRADNLSKHVQTHNEEPVQCKICKKLLKNSQSLRTHSLIHRGVTYTCEICGRTCKVKSEHIRHMKTHVDPNARKTMCTICGKRVRHLKHHMLTHTGEKPHVCRHCNKRFTSPYGLKVHERQHSDQKPFICECCSMGFNQKISLLSHLKSKHGAQGE